MTKATVTFKYRIKDANKKELLKKWSSEVNFVWNYCNATQLETIKRFNAGGDKFRQSGFDLNALTSGTTEFLNIGSTTIQEIGQEYALRCKQFKKTSLRWRTRKRNTLGWIPFKKASIKIFDGYFKFNGIKFRYWNSRPINNWKSGSITEDTKGNWYLNIVTEVEKEETSSTKEIGIDLGLKTIATCSDGYKIENPKTLNKYAEKLAKAQRANKKKLVTSIHNKIKNIRKDFLHKESTKLVRDNKKIFVGDVSSLKLAKTKMAKSVLDAGWGGFKSMLEYKAKQLGVEYKVVGEKYSTVTCSCCGAKAPFQSGLSSLGVRSWECSECLALHDRDINAAQNILNFARGHASLIKGIPWL